MKLVLILTAIFLVLACFFVIYAGIYLYDIRSEKHAVVLEAMAAMEARLDAKLTAIQTEFDKPLWWEGRRK